MKTRTKPAKRGFNLSLSAVLFFMLLFAAILAPSKDGYSSKTDPTFHQLIQDKRLAADIIKTIYKDSHFS